MTYGEYLEKIVWGNDWRVPLIIWGIIILGFLVGCLIIVARYCLVSINELFGQVKALEFSKQDDKSEYISNDEWSELCKAQGFDFSVKPYEKITRNQAIRLLEYLTNQKIKE